MAKYHITRKGEPGVCRATRNCPLGGADEHYETKQEAQEAFERSMAEQQASPSISKKDPVLSMNVPRRVYGYRGRTYRTVLQNIKEDYERALREPAPTPAEAIKVFDPKGTVVYTDAYYEEDERTGKVDLVVEFDDYPDTFPDATPAHENYDEDDYALVYDVPEDIAKKVRVGNQARRLKNAYETMQRDDLPSWAAIPRALANNAHNPYYSRRPAPAVIAAQQELAIAERNLEKSEKAVALIQKDNAALKEIQAREEEAEKAYNANKNNKLVQRLLDKELTSIRNEKGNLIDKRDRHTRECLKRDERLGRVLAARKTLVEREKIDRLRREQELVNRLASHYPHSHSATRVKKAKEWVKDHPGLVDREWADAF